MRGDLLPENRYDDWAEERRHQLEGMHQTLTRELAALPNAAGLGALRADASSFVGRGHELGELRTVLGRTRLLTLTGTGGAGKTRLALELARGEQSRFADGAVLVELATLTDPGTVPVAVAAVLDVRALAGQGLRDAIGEFLAGRSLLLVLDNCEHLIGASADLVDGILRGAPGVTVLATSREPLRIPGEVVFRVPSLAIPDPEQPLAPDEAAALRGGPALRRPCRGGSARRSRSTRGTRPTSRASASGSTACRSPSSSPPVASVR